MPQEWKLLSHLKNKLKLETLGNPILQTMKEEEKGRKKKVKERGRTTTFFFKGRLFYLLKILLMYLEGKETHTHSSSSLLPWLQQQVLSQGAARSLRSHLGLPCGWKRPKSLCCHLLPAPGHIRGNLALRYSRDSNPGTVKRDVDVLSQGLTTNKSLLQLKKKSVWNKLISRERFFKIPRDWFLPTKTDFTFLCIYKLLITVVFSMESKWPERSPTSVRKFCWVFLSITDPTECKKSL